MTNLDFNLLPTEVQEDAKEWLKFYDTVNVVFEYGKYNVSSGLALKSSYGSDHKFVGSYKAKEIFTEDERILNYMEAFHEYHSAYKGKRDYKWVYKLTWDDRFEFDNDGNIVKIEA